MNRRPSHRSPADLRPVFLFAVVVYLFVAMVLVMALGAAGSAAGPLHPPPGMGL